MPSDFYLKTANAAHRAILGITRGRVGWRVRKMPVLELTTTCRKSGMSRSVMLTSPLQENNVIVIVASRGGDDNYPTCILNLRDNPQLEVAYTGKPKRKMTVRVATDSKRARMRPLVMASYKGYG